MIKDENITFGNRYTDDTTGFAGTATAHARYQGGESSVRLETLGADGMVKAEWFPPARLSFTEK